MRHASMLQAVQLLIDAVERACSGIPALASELQADCAALLIDPGLLRTWLEDRLSGHAGRVRVAGNLDRRLVFIERFDSAWIIVDLSGRPHLTRAWPSWTEGHIVVADPDSAVSIAQLDDTAVTRLSRPNVLLAALYHPEYFPLPRFPLGISDVARAARGTLLGTVGLADMQLGLKLDDVKNRVYRERPDILGISATFGQHDLMTELLDATYAMPNPPLIIAGGSLTARNEGLLLARYPELLIARGAGEATIAGLLQYWHGDIVSDQVPALGYNGAARGGGMAIGRRRTPRPVTRQAHDDILPELDLLPATFEHHGVAQLETSRGCTNYCSFCPRGHKGIWAGVDPRQLPWMLNEMSAVFDRYPHIARVLYLVDEEFIGRDEGALTRALAVAQAVHEADFYWESSCRIDQVVRLDLDHAWHAERVVMWRELLRHGLRRMLFGVESGVDSILDRFNKETTGQQNALAIRTLSALGVPTRFTYITFDHLMSLAELKATYAFQGRTDLLLRPLPNLSTDEIVRGIRDEDFVAAAATGRPLHTEISYMLVSMECLIGAAYTHKAEKAGLTGQVRPSMGRVDARFADWRIGVASQWAQLWVDRNFALDYTLKSLEKILDGLPRRVAREARSVLKDASYTVLGLMIQAIEEQVSEYSLAAESALSWTLERALQAEIGVLQSRMAATVTEVASVLPAERRRVLHTQHERWASATGWRLINAADPCGT